MSATHPLGYPDWQRLENWDGPVLWIPDTNVDAFTQSSPIMEVSRYNGIGGNVAVTTGQITVSFLWFADSALTQPTGRRDVTMDSAYGAFAQLRMTNLGPYCQIQIALNGTANYQMSTSPFFPTDRSYPAEFVPRLAALGGGGGVAVGPTSIGRFVLQPVYGGRVKAWLGGDPNGGLWQLEYLTTTGTYGIFHEHVMDANGQASEDVALPLASCRFAINNNTAAGRLYNWGVVAYNGQ